MEKVKRENIGEHLFSYQLEIIGKTRIDVIDSPNFHYYFTMSRTQYSEFRDYAIKLMMKTFKCNKNKAISNFNWYWEQFGTKIRG